MADSQKMGIASSGGQRIDDHSFWAGSRNKASVFPDGPHKEKQYMSAEGAGSEMNYQDTSEKIKSSQDEATRKAKAHQGKLPQYRN